MSPVLFVGSLLRQSGGWAKDLLTYSKDGMCIWGIRLRSRDVGFFFSKTVICLSLLVLFFCLDFKK